MRKLIPLVLILFGAAGGLAAGMALKPPDAGGADCQYDPSDGKDATASDHCKKEKGSFSKSPDEKLKPSEFVLFNRQFVVPIVRDSAVQALVVATLALEVDEGATEHAYSLEPKLRDAFLDVLFTHAHSGGFDGSFTSRGTMADLRGRLNEVAKSIVGDTMQDVLITEIVRSDL